MRFSTSLVILNGGWDPSNLTDQFTPVNPGGAWHSDRVANFTSLPALLLPACLFHTNQPQTSQAPYGWNGSKFYIFGFLLSVSSGWLDRVSPFTYQSDLLQKKEIVSELFEPTGGRWMEQGEGKGGKILKILVLLFFNFCNSGLGNLLSLSRGCCAAQCSTNHHQTSLLRRVQAQTLPDATPPIGQMHPFSKMTITFKPLIGFRCPSGFRKFLITMI